MGLRSYGQRDPLIEYKKEAFSLFSNLLDKLKLDYVKILMNLKVYNDPTEKINQRHLKEKFKIMPNVRYQPSIEQAIKSINLKQGDLLLITGSLYGAAEVLSLN